MKINRMARIVCMVVLAGFLATPVLRSQSWAPQETTVPSHFSAVSFLDDQIGYVSGAFGIIFKTTNSGLTWVLKPSGTGLHFSDQYFVNASVGWVVGQGGVIMKTTDGGATWTQQGSGTTSWLNTVRFGDSKTGWAAGANGTIVKTTNGGATWTTQQCGTTSTIEGGWFTSINTGVHVVENGMILRTQNGGTNWSSIQSSTTQPLNAAHFPSSTVGWAAGANGKIIKTTDGGGTWFDQPSGTTQNLNSVAFANTDTGWVVGDGGTIRWTTNGGTTWSSQISGTTENLRGVFFVNAHHGYAVGLNNTILEYAVIHAVPIQLASFTAAVVNNHTVRLDWRTISEVNNYGFEVERAIGSPTGFVVITTSIIPGHGTTNEPRNYTFTDNNAPSGRLYYRLKQIDLDGTINYTEPISVDVLTGVGENVLPTEFSLKQNYPNPFNPSTKIEFSIAKAGFVSLKVYDILGREAATIVNERLNQGNYTKTFSGEGLSSGVYWYKLTSSSFSQTKKFVLSK